MAEYNMNEIPSELRPISMWGYFGYQILFAIPVIGWIVALVFAFTAKNLNLKNYARAQFCIIIIEVVVIVLMSILGIAMPGGVSYTF